MLQFLGKLVSGHAPVESDGILHAILQEQVIGKAQEIVIGNLLMVFERG